MGRMAELGVPGIENTESAPPTADEKSMAALAYFLLPVGGPIGPFVILLLRRRVPYVAFHALQALIWMLGFVVATFGSMAVLMGVMFASMPPGMKGQPPAPAPKIFFLFPIVWLIFMGGWALTIVITIIYGMRANRGERASLPVIGSLAQRWLRIPAAQIQS